MGFCNEACAFSVSLLLCLCLCLTLCISLPLSGSLCIAQSLTLCLCLCLSVYLSVCLSVCLSLSLSLSLLLQSLVAMKARITKDDLKQKAISVLRQLLPQQWRMSRSRKRLRALCIEEQPWRAQVTKLQFSLPSTYNFLCGSAHLTPTDQSAIGELLSDQLNGSFEQLW